jgi:peptidoglycan/LPS O-acetylase OafA/YrhL
LPAQKLDALTGLRFFAAFAIVIHHLHAFGLPKSVLGGWALDNGVAFFFVLSGFILTYVYPKLDTPAAVRRFWVARFARIWPAHMAALALCYLLLAGDPSLNGTGIDRFDLLLANILLIHAWIPYAEYFFGYNSVSWSISTEVFFYAAFPFLIASFARTWWAKLAGVAVLSLVLVLVSIATDLAVYTSLDQGVTLTGVLYINPLARIFEFVVGMCAALLWRTSITKVRIGPVAGTVIECAAVALLLISFYAVAQLGHWVNTHYGFAGAQWLGQGSGMALSFAALIFVMAFQKGYISAVIGSRLGVFLGEISFMIYLIHYVLLRAYVLHAEWFAAWNGQVLLAFYLTLLFALSWLLWLFIEKPMRKLIITRLDPAPRIA